MSNFPIRLERLCLISQGPDADRIPVAAEEASGMKICDICHQTVDRLESGPKGMESLDCCEPCLSDLRQRIMQLEQEIQQQRERLWREMLENWRKERAAGRTPVSPSGNSSPN
jgi:hypothetical protein